MDAIRRLGPADAAAYQALRLQGLLECPSAFASSHEEEVGRTIESIAERLQPQAGSAQFGAFEVGRLVGQVGLVRESHRKLAHKGFIWGMYVEPAARERGLGRQLLQAAKVHALNEMGLRQINLGVSAGNRPAIQLYEAQGFVRFGREDGFLWADGQLFDELHMVCILNPNHTFA